MLLSSGLSRPILGSVLQVIGYFSETVLHQLQCCTVVVNLLINPISVQTLSHCRVCIMLVSSLSSRQNSSIRWRRAAETAENDVRSLRLS